MAGSAVFNWDSIDAKIDAAMNTPAKQAEISKAFNGKIRAGDVGKGVVPPNEVGEMFKSVLDGSIYDHVGSYTEYAAYRLAHHEVSSITSVGDGKYEITVSPSTEMSRPSLVPKYFPDGISELDMLLNNGVDKEMNQVHGYWHGMWVGSKTIIDATNFYEDAIQDFMTAYGEECSVIDITLDSEYAK